MKLKCVEVYEGLYHQEPFDVAFCPYRISPLGAHIDHQYGKINAVLFLIFVVINGIETLIAALRSDAGKWRFLPLMSAVGFAMVSMTENFLMTMPMLMFFFSIPLCKYYGEKK